MKILFVTHCTGMAGANRSMLQLMLELRDNYGVEPFVLLPPDSSKEKNLKHYLSEENIGYIEIEIPYLKRPYCQREYRLDYVYYLREIEKLCRTKLASMHFDLVHSNSSVIDFGGYISQILGIKHVWHLRDFGDLDYGLYSIWGHLYDKATYKNADAFIAISDCIKKHFEKVVNPQIIHTIYNGVKPKENIPLATHQNETVQFLCAGAICEGKNQKEILEAINILVNDRKVTQLHLTIVGFGGGSYLDELKSFVKEHHLNAYVIFMAPVDGIEELASTMDVGIMPSKCEAFGRVTVEYMLQNLAVIANDSGANKEIVTDGETGLVYPCGNTDALADNMQVLISDRQLLKKLSERGNREARQRFLSVQNTEKVFDLYIQLLNSPAKLPISLKNQLVFRIMMLLHYKDVMMQRIRRN